MKYELRRTPGYTWVGDAQVIGEHLESLLEEGNGELTPDRVVVDAISPKSPLHPNFEWDDKEAAHLHRRTTARALIGAVIVVEIEHKPVLSPVRAFVNIYNREEQRQYYTTTVTAMSDADMKRQVLQEAWEKLQSWRQRYRDLEEFSRIIEAINKAEIEIKPMLIGEEKVAT